MSASFRPSIFLMLMLVTSQLSYAEIAVDAKANRMRAAVGVEIQFEAMVSSTEIGPVRVDWNFGDGSPGSSVEATRHSFNTPGIYAVTVEAKSAKNDIAKKALSIEIKNTLSPSADFYVKRTNLVVGENLGFFSMAFDSDGSIEGYEWFLDGLRIGTGKTLYHVFSTPGEFSLVHKVTDDLGAETSMERRISVRAANLPPQVQIYFAHKNINRGDEILLRAEAKDSDGAIKSYFWKFDALSEFVEGTSVHRHVFPLTGWTRVWVKVIDNQGAESTTVERVFVSDPDSRPIAAIEVLARNIFSNTDVDFVLKLSNERGFSGKIDWDFGDGIKESTPGHKDRISHSYVKPGDFVVTAKFRDRPGLEVMTVSEKVTVLEREVSVATVPNQVIIDKWDHTNNSSYMELIPTQYKYLSAAAYNQSGSALSPTSATWTSSNSGVVTITSASVSSATITGVAAGTATIAVNLDGTPSQNIVVVVVPFSNHIAAAKMGDFFDSTLSNMYVGLDKTTGTYEFGVSYSNSPWDIYWHSDSNYLSDSLHFDLPTSKTEMSIDVSNTASPFDSYSLTKTGLRRFMGRDGFLYLPTYGTDTATIAYQDDRFLKLNSDFTLSFWLNQGGYGSADLRISGDYITYVNGQRVGIQTSAGYRQINFPYKSLNRWAHIAVTYTQSTRTVKAYYDGYMVGSVVVPNSPYSPSTSSMSILKYSGSASIDELRFWNSELTAAQVKSELFTPVELPSSDILAAFIFDDGSSATQMDDNEGDWQINLNSTPIPGGAKNIVLVDNLGEADTWVSTLSSYSIRMPLENQEVSIKLPTEAFDTNELFEASVHACIGVCKVGETLLSQYQLGPVLNVSSLPTPNKLIEVRLPFDSKSASITDPTEIKVARAESSIDGSQMSEIYEPNEVNLAEGYVSFQFSVGGDYWVTKPVGYSQVNYTNSDLLRSTVNYWGYRTFYTTIPSGVSTYDLDAGYSNSVVDRVSCNGNAVADTTFPLNITSLSQTTNYCYVYYCLNYCGAGTLRHRDLIIIQKI